MRLGFTVRVFGIPGGSSDDAPQIVAGTPLSARLAYLCDILRYLASQRIHLYRMHARLVPAWAARDLAAWCRHLDDHRGLLRLVGALAEEADLRLTFHPYSDVTLNAPDEERAVHSMGLLEAQHELLRAMELGPEAVIVLHTGGVYGDKERASECFVRRYESLPESVRARLVLENDDRRFHLVDVMRIHRQCGIPVVLDTLHHLVLNAEPLPLREALSGALGTWPEHLLPKVHFSTPRTEMRQGKSQRIKVPTWTEHADYVNPFEFIAFLKSVAGLPTFDVMLEAKARDLALIQLRHDLQRFAPELAARYDL